MTTRAITTKTTLADLHHVASCKLDYIAAKYPNLPHRQELWPTLCHEAAHNVALMTVKGARPGDVHISFNNTGYRANLLGDAHIGDDHNALVYLIGVAYEDRHGHPPCAAIDLERAQRIAAMAKELEGRRRGYKFKGLPRILEAAEFIVDNHFDLIEATAAGYLLGLPSGLHGGGRSTRVSDTALKVTHGLIRPLVPDFESLFAPGKRAKIKRQEDRTKWQNPTSPTFGS